MAEPTRRSHSPRLRQTLALALVAAVTAAPLLGQTPVEPPSNRFSPEEDVQLGREAAAEVRKQYPIIEDPAIREYVEGLGRELVAQAPPALDHDVFEYSFTAVNLKEINAFALPGGPMFVNRGMIEAAETEAEVAGVMAHELAHVLLRHGTANATKAQGFQLGALAGAIAGAIVGGGWGRVISEGSQFGLGTWMMKYSREYEQQADLLGAQLMARAGYDPRSLARMFETIERESKNGAPEWLSSHPNPGNRSGYIAQEAAQLRIAERSSSPAEFRQVRQRLASLPPAKSMADLARAGGAGGGGEAPASVGRVGAPVPPPSNSYRTVRGGDLLQFSAPSNWQALSSNSAIKVVPQNGYGELDGQAVFTHGVEVGVARAASRDLQESTNALLTAFGRSNPDLRRAGNPRQVRLSGRTAIENPLVNRSATGKQERVNLFTTFLRDGSLLYLFTIAPTDEASRYQPAFRRVVQTLRINDR